MANDIEEFLKRAMERRLQQAAKQQKAKQQPAGGTERPPPPAPPRSQPARPAPNRPAREQVVTAEVIDELAQDDVRRGATVAAHVSQHLNTQEYVERATHLGEQVGQADDVMEARMHSTFEHTLGNLGASTSSVEDSILDPDSAKKTPSKRRSSLVSILRNPQQVRNAIVLSEILARPEHRWD